MTVNAVRIPDGNYGYVSAIGRDVSHAAIADGAVLRLQMLDLQNLAFYIALTSKN